MAKRVEVVLAAEDEASKTVEDVASNFASMERAAKELSDVAAALSSVVSKLEDVLKQAGTQFQQGRKGVSDFAQSTKQAGQESEKARAEFKAGGDAASQASKGFEQSAKAASDSSTEFKKTATSLKEAEAVMNSAKDEVNKLALAYDKAKAEIKPLKDEVDRLDAELFKAKNVSNSTEAEIKQLSNALNQAKAAFKDAQVAVKPLEADLGKAKIASKEASDQFKEMGGKGKFDQLIEGVKGIGDKIGSLPEPTEKARGATDKLVEKMGGLGKAGPVVAAGLAMAATAAIDLGKKALEGAIEVEKSFKLMAAQTGTTGEDLKRLKGVSEEVFKTGITGDIKEVNNTVVALKQTMKGIGDEDLAKLTTGALTLKEVFGADEKEIAKVAATLKTNFGLEGAQSVDFVTAAFQRGGDKSGDLLDTFNEYSVQFKRMGFDANEFTSILITGLDQGAFNADKVADSVKEFNIRIRDGSDTTKQALTALGIDFNDFTTKLGSGAITGKQAMELINDRLRATTDSVKQNIAGVGLYGTQWEDVGPKVILSLDQGTKALGDVSGATQKATDTINSGLGPALQKIQNTATVEFVQGLDKAFESVGDSMKDVGPVIQEISRSVGEFVGGTLKNLIEQGQKLYNEIKPAFDDIAKTVSDILPPGQSLSDLMNGPLGIGFQFVGTQIKIVLGFIDATAHAVKALLDWLKPVTDALGWLGDTVSKLPNPFGDSKKAIDDNKGAVQAWGDSAAAASNSVQNWGTNTVTTSQQLAASSGGGASWAASADVAATASTTAAGAVQVWGDSAAAAGATVTAAGQQAAAGFSAGVGQMPVAAQTAMTGVSGAVQGGMSAAVAGVQQGGAAMNEGLTTAISNMHEGIVESLNDIALTARDIAPTIAKEIQANTSAVTQAMGKVEDEVRASGDRMVSTSRETGDKIISALGSGFGGLQSTLNKLDSDFQSFFSKMTQQAAASGSAAGQAYSANLAAGVAAAGGGVLANIAPNSGVTNAGAANAAQSNGAASFDFVKEYIQNRGKTPSTEKGPGRNQIGLDSGGGGSIGNFLQGRGAYYNPDSGKPVNINVNVGGQKFGKIVADTQTGQLKSTMGVGGFK